MPDPLTENGARILASVIEFLCIALSAACGGLAKFLHAFRNGRIRNNRYKAKVATDISGGLLVGFFGTVPAAISLGIYTRLGLAFVLGFFWAGAMDLIRNRLTNIVKAALRAAINEDMVDNDEGEEQQ